MADEKWTDKVNCRGRLAPQVIGVEDAACRRAGKGRCEGWQIMLAKSLEAGADCSQLQSQ